MTDPQPGSVSFIERIGKLGLSGLCTIGLLGVASYMVISQLTVPQWYIALVVGVTAGTVYVKYKGK
ncbi:MAG: hypothetical protein WC657_08995 [Candidatus Paceibacterota bacterium]|jgi:hypothetical protein